jgi:23S rRNA pseudouridine2605 synthase
VYQLVPQKPGLHQVGRLDKDSEGLLLLTNDGHLTERLTHPRYGIQKIYRVWCKKGEVSFSACRKLVEGVPLDDYIAKAIEAKPMNGGARVVMSEGKKREVKRMLASVGYPVERLLRTQVGPVLLEDLQPGQWRYLSAEEITELERFSNPEFAKATKEPKAKPLRPAQAPARPAQTPRPVAKPKPAQRPKPPRPSGIPKEIPDELLPRPKRKSPAPEQGRTKRTDRPDKPAIGDKPKPLRQDQPKPRFDSRKKPRNRRG